MIESKKSTDLLKRVSLFDLQVYLEHQGWQRTSGRSDKWDVFKSNRSSGSSLELVLPSSERFVDARARIESAVSALSQIQDRSPDTVSREIVKAMTDSLVIRVALDHDVSSIPLLDAAKQVSAIRKLLLFGTCSEVEVRPHFEQPLPSALAMVDGFEFCHTFQGSFGFEIASPVTTEGATSDIFNLPTRRRVMERIARGLQALEIATSAGSPEVLVESYTTAFNARMCDALVEIGGQEEMPFEVGIDWATFVMPANDVLESGPLRIGGEQISFLKFAAERLKVVEPHTSTVRGHVINLHCTRNPLEGSARRTIEIKTVDSNEGVSEVRISLSPTSYAVAIEAHSRGLLVEAIGQLQRRGNLWTLEAVSSFQALEHS